MDRNNWEQLGRLELALRWARGVGKGDAGRFGLGYVCGYAAALAAEKVIEKWEAEYVMNVAFARNAGVAA